MPRMSNVGRNNRGRRPKSKKQNTWKKNRRFGQASGGESVFRPTEFIPSSALPRPRPNERLPILIENRPHRDHYFPMTGEEVMARIRQLPAKHVEGITHVWLRRLKPNATAPFGSCVTGPGFRAILLYPWPRDRKLLVGASLTVWWKKFVRDYQGVLERERGMLFAVFPEEQVRRFYRDDLILHEVGHHVDSRRFSRANLRQAEEFATQYAAEWARRLDEPPTRKARSPLKKKPRGHLVTLAMEAFPKLTVVFGRRGDIGPHPELNVSFKLVDRKGRDRSGLVWIRREAVERLTLDGLRERIERARQNKRAGL